MANFLTSRKEPHSTGRSNSDKASFLVLIYKSTPYIKVVKTHKS